MGPREANNVLQTITITHIYYVTNLFNHLDSKLNHNNIKGTQEAGSEQKLSVSVSVSAKISVSVLADISTFILTEIFALKCFIEGYFKQKQKIPKIAKSKFCFKFFEI